MTDHKELVERLNERASNAGLVFYTEIGNNAALDREAASAISSLVEEMDRLAEALRDLMRGYVNTMENGRDRILSLGGECDPVDVMEAAEPCLRRARTALASMADAGRRALSEQKE